MQNEVEYLLPYELWLHVFSYMSSTRNLAVLNCVCSRFRDICDDPRLWTALSAFHPCRINSSPSLGTPLMKLYHSSFHHCPGLYLWRSKQCIVAGSDLNDISLWSKDCAQVSFKPYIRASYIATEIVIAASCEWHDMLYIGDALGQVRAYDSDGLPVQLLAHPSKQIQTQIQSLAVWNLGGQTKQLLASGSSDGSIALWDQVGRNQSILNPPDINRPGVVALHSLEGSLFAIYSGNLINRWYLAGEGEGKESGGEGPRYESTQLEVPIGFSWTRPPPTTTWNGMLIGE